MNFDDAILNSESGNVSSPLKIEITMDSNLIADDVNTLIKQPQKTWYHNAI